MDSTQNLLSPEGQSLSLVRTFSCSIIFLHCRCSSEFLQLAITSFDTSFMSRVLPLIEDLIQVSSKDSDAIARKNGRR